MPAQSLLMQPFEDSRDLSALDADFAVAARRLIAACEEKGAKVRPFFTMRGPGVQARLWCQSRTPEQVIGQRAALEKAGAPWLASLLKPELASRGPALTNALPGLSWHQWGEALDCFVVGTNGSAIWNAAHPHYRIYAEEARALGLEAGALWKRFPDAVHVQKRKAASPLREGLSWQLIEEEMRRRFGAV